MRPDCIIATGRSDYPNQVNNVLCFPFIFRGALDAGATTITEADEARRHAGDRRAGAAGAIGHRGDGLSAMPDLSFGPEYLIPKPFDPRLIVKIAPAVAKAAMESGVATRPIADLERLPRSAHPVRLSLRPDHEAGVRRREEKSQARGVLRGRGPARAARGASRWWTKGIARPIVIGRPEVVQRAPGKAGPARAPGQGLRAGQSRTAIRASATTGSSTTTSCSARASRWRWPSAR